MLLAVRLTWRHSETHVTSFVHILSSSNERKALDKLCKARLYCDADRQFHFRNYTKCGTFIVKADFICM